MEQGNSNWDHCPACGHTLFFDGPHAGLAVNVRCAGCLTAWWFGGPFGWKQIACDERVFQQRARPLTEII